MKIVKPHDVPRTVYDDWWEEKRLRDKAYQEFRKREKAFSELRRLASEWPDLVHRLLSELEFCQRCGTTIDLHLHHWAPSSLFADADDWPRSRLCTACHSLWHARTRTATVAGMLRDQEDPHAKHKLKKRQTHRDPRKAAFHLRFPNNWRAALTNRFTNVIQSLDEEALRPELVLDRIFCEAEDILERSRQHRGAWERDWVRFDRAIVEAIERHQDEALAFAEWAIEHVELKRAKVG